MAISNINYLASDKIKVYPTAGRTHSSDAESYLNTEYNLIQAKKLSKVSDLNSYVVLDTEAFTITNNVPVAVTDALIIYLAGYMFRVTKSQIRTICSTGNVWAVLRLVEDGISTTQTSPNSLKSQRLDNLATTGAKLDISNGSGSSLFKGLGFTTTEPTLSDSEKLMYRVIQVLDSDGNIPVSSTYKLNSSEIKDNVTGVGIDKHFNTEMINGTTISTTSGLLNINSEQLKINSGKHIKTSADIDVTGKVDIKSAITVNTSSSTTIKAPVTINKGLTVGATSTYTGDVEIKSAGSSKTTIIGPNNGTINLPSNASSNNSVLIQATTGTSDWKTFTDSDTASTIASRDTNGATKFKDVYLTNQKTTVGVYGVKVDNTGKLIKNDLHLDEPTAGGYTTSFIDTISQSSDGKISATKKTIPTATSSALGLVKGGSTSGNTYGVSVDSNGAMTVNIPWSNTEYSAGTGLSLSGTTFNHSNSVTAKTTAGLYKVKYDAQGHITGTDSVVKSDITALGIPGSDTTYSVASGSNLTLTGTVFDIKESPQFSSLSVSGTVSAETFDASSDERLKTNIVDYVNKSSILDLPIKEFDYKETGTHTIGCIAQDLQKMYPELVDVREDGYLTIKETKLVYLLIDEVKKLKAKVDELEKR